MAVPGEAGDGSRGRGFVTRVAPPMRANPAPALRSFGHPRPVVAPPPAPRIVRPAPPLQQREARPRRHPRHRPFYGRTYDPFYDPFYAHRYTFYPYSYSGHSPYVFRPYGYAPYYGSFASPKSRWLGRYLCWVDGLEFEDEEGFTQHLSEAHGVPAGEALEASTIVNGRYVYYGPKSATAEPE